MRLFSISTPINENRDEYYEMLAESSRINPSVDLTVWVKWFAEISKNAQVDAKNKDTKLNKRQNKITNKFFELGEEGLIKAGVKSERYQSITGCSSATATRDLKDMVEKGILTPSQSGGRSLHYFIILIQEKLIFCV